MVMCEEDGNGKSSRGIVLVQLENRKFRKRDGGTDSGGRPKTPATTLSAGERKESLNKSGGWGSGGGWGGVFLGVGMLEENEKPVT